MGRTYRRHVVAFFIWCTAVVAGISISFVGCRRRPSNMASKRTEQELVEQEREAMKLRVDPGEPQKAVDYYTDILTELGLKNWDSLPADPDQALQQLATLQSMEQPLKFLGYTDLFPADFEKNVENLSSAQLMAKYPNEILASAFFAPKITDVSADPSKINVGWRKVVYLKARKGSPAETKGISYGVLLFNKFQGAGNWAEDPIKPRKDKIGNDQQSNESKTTQFMLIRADGSSLKYPNYFLVYGRLSEGGKLQAFLTASFDARDPTIGPQGKYYVPNACEQCHGAEIGTNRYDLKKVRLNFLDTDHWFDRVQAGDDFAFLQQYDYGVLYDGGKVFDVKDGDTVSQQFKDAFNVLRQINEKIKEQNEKVDADTGGTPSIQSQAVGKWWALHVNGNQADFVHKNVFLRAFDGGVKWSDSNPTDKELLPLMNQYCYRCHSSVRFSIFDRPTVALKRFGIKARVEAENMPQDRKLSPDVKQKIINLVLQLAQ
jgi:hypothetical protein